MSQKVLVAGSGISGIAAAKLLLAKGGEVVLYDGNDKLDAEKIKKNFDEDAKVSVVLGELKRTDLLGVELSVISPGIPLDAPFVTVLDVGGSTYRGARFSLHTTVPKESWQQLRELTEDDDNGADRRDYEIVL